MCYWQRYAHFGGLAFALMALALGAAARATSAARSITSVPGLGPLNGAALLSLFTRLREASAERERSMRVKTRIDQEKALYEQLAGIILSEKPIAPSLASCTPCSSNRSPSPARESARS